MSNSRIPKKLPKKPSSTTKSIYFPNEVIEMVEKAICKRNCSFSGFIVAAVKHTLENMEEWKQ